MFEEGLLLRFDPFIFKNGAQPKPKYFVVLKHMGEDLMMATLPTSQDHIPNDLSNLSGCISIQERGVNAYVFNPDIMVTETFSFPLRTYVYGEQVDEYSQTYLDNMGSTIENLGIMKQNLFDELRKCVKQSPLIKRKYFKLL